MEIILVQGDTCNDNDFQLFKQHLVVPQVPILETEIYGDKIILKLYQLRKRILIVYSGLIKNIIFVYSSSNFY